MNELISKPSNLKPWQEMALPSFLIQQFSSTVGAMIVGVLAAVIPAILIAAVTKNTSGGNWADHIAEQPILRAGGEHYFAFPVIAGFALGALSRRYLRSFTGAFVWVLPTMILVWNLFTWKTGGFRPYWPDVWDNYFGSHCTDSECLYEFFVTAPFYTSTAYTVGWIAQHVLISSRAHFTKSDLV